MMKSPGSICACAGRASASAKTITMSALIALALTFKVLFVPLASATGFVAVSVFIGFNLLRFEFAARVRLHLANHAPKILEVESAVTTYIGSHMQMKSAIQKAGGDIRQ